MSLIKLINTAKVCDYYYLLLSCTKNLTGKDEESNKKGIDNKKRKMHAKLTMATWEDER